MDYTADPPFEFTINGKTYEVLPIGEREYPEYLRWKKIFAGTTETPSEDDEGAQLLGEDVYAAMLADKVPAKAIRAAMLAVFVDGRLEDRALAEESWRTGLDPKALRAAAGETTSTGMESESATPSPASTRTTTSPKASSRKSAAKASRSPKSSPKPS